MNEAEYIKTVTDQQKEILDLSSEDWFPFYLIPAQIQKPGDPNPLLGEYGIELYEPYVQWVKDWASFGWMEFGIVDLEAKNYSQNAAEIDAAHAIKMIEMGLFTSSLTHATVCFCMYPSVARRTGLGTWWDTDDDG